MRRRSESCRVGRDRRQRTVRGSATGSATGPTRLDLRDRPAKRARRTGASHDVQDDLMSAHVVCGVPPCAAWPGTVLELATGRAVVAVRRTGCLTDSGIARAFCEADIPPGPPAVLPEPRLVPEGGRGFCKSSRWFRGRRSWPGACS